MTIKLLKEYTKTNGRKLPKGHVMGITNEAGQKLIDEKKAVLVNPTTTKEILSENLRDVKTKE